jgi:predicted dinucleotide-binding enzyme
MAGVHRTHRGLLPDGGEALKRVLIIGGYGNFGGYIARALAPEAQIKLLIAGRSLDKASLSTLPATLPQASPKQTPISSSTPPDHFKIKVMQSLKLAYGKAVITSIWQTPASS